MVSGCDRELNAHFYCVASLKYHALDTWHDTTPSHIILTLPRTRDLKFTGVDTLPTDYRGSTSLVCTWIYCTCMCKLLMFRCSRSVQMMHNVKKNNIDHFEVHEHVSSFQIHVYIQLQINLKCTDVRPQIIWSYMRALSEHQTIERKDRLH